MKFAFFDAKPYDKVGFDRCASGTGLSIKYFETRLNEDTVSLARGFDGVCVFDGETKSGAPLAVSFRPGRTGKAELRVMLEAAKDGDSGIKGGVMLRMK